MLNNCSINTNLAIEKYGDFSAWNEPHLKILDLWLNYAIPEIF